MTPLIIASAAIGGIGGLLANQQRIDALDQNRKYIRDQEKLLGKQEDVGRSLLSIRAKAQGIQNTQSSRLNAIESARGAGKAEAVLGTSGTIAGTPFYSLLSGIEESRKTLNENNQLGDLAMQQIAMSGIQQSLSFEGQRLQISQQLDQIDTESDYLNSPLAAVMAIGTGALAGANVGVGLQGVADKYFGVPHNNPVQFPSGSYASDATYHDQAMKSIGNPFSIMPGDPLNVDPNLFGSDMLPRASSIDVMNEFGSLSYPIWSS